LPTLGDQFARLAEEAVKEKQSHLSYLEALLEAEVEERDHRAMARRIQEARFPAVKTLEPHISVAVMRNLSEGGYLARKEPVIFWVIRGQGKRSWQLRWRWPPAGSTSGCGLRQLRKW
jgi:hypothetical protein